MSVLLAVTYLLTYRCRRIVTTASAELTSLSVNYGGTKTLITETALVTRKITEAYGKQTADMTSPRQRTCRVRIGMLHC